MKSAPLADVEATPVLDGAENSFSTEWMDANLIPNEPFSIYLQEPSREVDITQIKLADMGPIPISREDVLAIGRDPETAVCLSQEFRLGSNVYAGRIDMFHQLHCMDVV